MKCHVDGVIIQMPFFPCGVDHRILIYLKMLTVHVKVLTARFKMATVHSIVVTIQNGQWLWLFQVTPSLDYSKSQYDRNPFWGRFSLFSRRTVTHFEDIFHLKPR